MTIKSLDEYPEGIHIDLTGPDGNAFYLMGLTRKLMNEYDGLFDKDADEIISRMMSGNYENLIAVFEEEFSEYVTLYR